jgi:hypothetical protein
MARIKRRSGSAKEIAALREQGIRNLSVSRECGQNVRDMRVFRG